MHKKYTRTVYLTNKMNLKLLEATYLFGPTQITHKPAVLKKIYKNVEVTVVSVAANGAKSG